MDDLPADLGLGPIAELLVSRLQPWLPSDVRLSLVGFGNTLMVVIQVNAVEVASFGFGSIALQSQGTQRENLRTAVSSLLDFVQDFLVHHTRLPWPGQELVLPVPTVVVRDDRIDAWFGSASAPALPPLTVPFVTGPRLQ